MIEIISGNPIVLFFGFVICCCILGTIYYTIENVVKGTSKASIAKSEARKAEAEAEIARATMLSKRAP
jgi:hypothetical protein